MRFILTFIRTWMAFFMDLLLGNAVNPLGARVAPYEMSSDMLDIARIAMDYTGLVWWEGLTEDDVTRVFEDPNDRVMIRYHPDQGVCYVSFKGASIRDFDDIRQSYPMIFGRDVCGAAGCCSVERGLHEAYYSDYVAEFEQAVDDCYNNCSGTGCRIVITGHSQGAAIAPVAAIALERYNPILLTFGQHLTQRGRCGVLDNLETYLRFTVVCDWRGNGRPSYDAITYQGNPFTQRHTGTLILLGPDGAATLARNRGMTLLPIAEPCHSAANFYVPYLRNLEPGVWDGFEAGAMCSRNVECKSMQCNGDQTCA